MEVLSNTTGWIFIPDLPSHRAAWFLNSELKEHAIMRLGAPRKQSWDLTVFRRVLLSWQFWLLPFIFMCKYLNWEIEYPVLISVSVLSLCANAAEQRYGILDGLAGIHHYPAEQLSYRDLCNCHYWYNFLCRNIGQVAISLGSLHCDWVDFHHRVGDSRI